MPRNIDVYLHLQDVKDMIQCKRQLEVVIHALAASSWQGSGPVIAALGPLDAFICQLYNRAEPFWLRYLNRGNPAPAAPTPSDPCPQVSEGSPAGAVQLIPEVK